MGSKSLTRQSAKELRLIEENWILRTALSRLFRTIEGTDLPVNHPAVVNAREALERKIVYGTVPTATKEFS